MNDPTSPRPDNPKMIALRANLYNFTWPFTLKVTRAIAKPEANPEMGTEVAIFGICGTCASVVPIQFWKKHSETHPPVTPPIVEG